MAVRTEKIQALTGSAPLTLPTSLPASSKGLQVSTTGVMSTPSTSDSLTHLTSSTGSDPGWVLLDHVEQNSAVSIMSVRNSSTTYPASDIYCYEIQFNIMGYYNNSGSSVYWSPTRSGTRNPNGTGRRSVGVYQSPGSGKSNWNANGNSTGVNGGYEYNMSYKMNGQSSPTGNNYSKMFDKAVASKSSTYGGDGGVIGRFRYYNGSGYAGPVIEPIGYNGRSGTGNSYGNWNFDRTAFSMPVSNNATYTSKVDGFDCWDQTGGTWGNANYKVMGFIQLWGMPKTTS
tara:strand:- start:345 stop:1202 length:858 start_codon:yes stop_codon:yes gene_type:complete